MSVNVSRLLSGVNNNFAERLTTNATVTRKGLPVDAWHESVRGKNASQAVESSPQNTWRERSGHKCSCQSPNTSCVMIQSSLTRGVAWAKTAPV
jgi:hypothetical protein